MEGHHILHRRSGGDKRCVGALGAATEAVSLRTFGRLQSRRLYTMQQEHDGRRRPDLFAHRIVGRPLDSRSKPLILGVGLLAVTVGSPLGVDVLM